MWNINNFSFADRPEQPSQSTVKLAREAFERGDFAEAERLYSLLAQTLSRMLGEKHVETIMALYNVAQCMMLQGRIKESEELTEQISQTFIETKIFKNGELPAA